MEASAEFLKNSYLVSIFSALPNNSVPLTVGCQSRDDDLGYYNLTVGQSFNYTLHGDSFMWPVTLSCHFLWTPKETFFQAFNERKYKCIENDRYYTKKCIWFVKPDGFILDGIKKYDW